MERGYQANVTLGLFRGGRDATEKLRDEQLSGQAMRLLLDCLLQIDILELRAFPDIPPVYKSGVKYRVRRSPCGEDAWRDILSCVEERIADCFPQGTLLLRDDFVLVPIEKIQVGDRIWGRDAWTTVQASVYKGLLSVDAMKMNNGSIVQLTGDHHVFVGRCDKHRQELDSGYGCSCRLEDRRVERIGLRDVKEKDVLITPERLPFGQQSFDPKKAYVEGLFVADGWSSTNHQFCISGLDGAKKEAQKHEVKQICDELKLNTYWHRKYIGVNNKEWALRMHEMGRHAPQKHVLSINLDEAAIAETLRGVMADSKVNANGGWTFTSTSKLLTIQTRIMHKMFGRSSSVMYFATHAGLGDNPIWILGVRDPKVKSGKLLRVKELVRDIAEAPCYDIQTSDGYVYLPEHDVTVSNCKDLACWRAGELIVRLGIMAKPVFIRQERPGDGPLYHILVEMPDGSYEDPSIILGMTAAA